ARLEDVAGDGRPPVLPEGLVAPFKVVLPEGEGERSAEATIRLPAIDHRFDVGHRVRLTISTTDLAYAVPDEPAVHRIALADHTLDLPVVSALVTPERGPDAWTWALPAVASAAAAALVLTGRRRPRG